MVKAAPPPFQRLLKWNNWSLKFQILIGISVIQSLITLSLAIYQYQSQKEILENQSLEEGKGVIYSLAASTISPLLTQDFSEIDNVIQAHAKNTHFEFIEIYDADKKRIGIFSRLPKGTSDKTKTPDSNPDESQETYHDHKADEFPAELSIVSRLHSKLIVSSPIKLSERTIGWITIHKDERHLTEAIHGILQKGLWLTLFSLILGFVLSNALAGLIVQQINKLRASVEKFGKGENSTRVETDSDNEIGKLGKEFNRMADQISEFQMKLLNSAKYSALGEMASGIAHEINNPLAIIVSRASSLQRKVSQGAIDLAKFNEELQKISDTSFRITRIVSSLRNLARDGSSEQADWVNLESVILEGLDLIREKLNQQSIQLKLEIPSHYEVLFSRVQLGQVVVNLISNSLDAINGSENAWIRISLSTEQDLLQIKFQDSGLGIPQAVREKMMQPFFTTKEVGKGTGLGLSINKGIVEKNQAQFYYDEKSPNTQFIIATKNFRVAQNKKAAA